MHRCTGTSCLISRILAGQFKPPMRRCNQPHFGSFAAHAGDVAVLYDRAAQALEEVKIIGASRPFERISRRKDGGSVPLRSTLRGSRDPKPRVQC